MVSRGEYLQMTLIQVSDNEILQFTQIMWNKASLAVRLVVYQIEVIDRASPCHCQSDPFKIIQLFIYYASCWVLGLLHVSSMAVSGI